MAVRLPESVARFPNPIELAEEVMTERDMPFDRLVEDELVAEVAGSWGHFRLWLSWEESLGALFLSSTYDMKIPQKHRKNVFPLIARINEHVLFGHFDISSEDGSVCYRYGQRVMDPRTVNQTLLEELLDLAVAECERFYPAFQTVLWGGKTSEYALKLVLCEPAGQA